MMIASYEIFGAAVEGASDDPVVIGIFRNGRNDGRGIDDFGESFDFFDQAASGFAGKTKFDSSENGFDFVQDGRRDDKRQLSPDHQVQDLSRLAAEDDRRNEDVRIEDDPKAPIFYSGHDMT